MRKLISFCTFILLSLLCFGQKVHIFSIDELNKSFGTDTHLAENRYKLEPDFRTIVELGKEELGHPKLHYPRIKVLKDGSYIMFYQSSRIGLHCYCAFSKDGINWTKGGRVFEAHKIVNSGGEEDTQAYSTVDAVVLENGDILAFVAYRAAKGYKRFPQDDGLCMKRSCDGGRTWGEEIKLYDTIVWEPFAMQLPSGEIQVYFTDSDHDWVPASSGVTMLRSLDNGYTWTTHGQVIRQYRATGTRKDGTPGTRICWTDQMPSAVVLGDGKTILAAVESQDSTNHFHITLAMDKTNWARPLKGNETGPMYRKDNFRSGGGPYLAHFPSGETALSFQGNFFNIKLGLSDFKSIVYGKPFMPFGKRKSLWGSMTTIDSHTLFATAPSLDENREYGTIMVGKMRLNHRVDAPFAKIKIDADNIDWATNTDALFLGSESPAQCCFRFAHDDVFLYVLVEYLDGDIIPRDEIKLSFSNGRDDKDIFETSIMMTSKGLKLDKSIRTKSYNEPGTGYLVEMAIALEDLPFVKDRVFIYPEIIKGNMIDTITESKKDSFGTWMPIKVIE